MKLKYFIFIILLVFSACSLDEKIYDTAESGSFIASEDDVSSLVNGVYSYLSAYNCFKSNLLYQIMYAGDDVATTNATYRLFRERTISASNGYFVTPWSSFYLTINNANAVLESLETTEVVSEAFRSRIAGELSFMRAFSYFYLVRLYGAAPIHTEPITGNSDFYPARNTVDEVYSLIFEDLKKANEHCLAFSQQPADEFGHATKGAAQAILALAYLTYANHNDLQGKPDVAVQYYQLAENFADSVILSGEYSLVNNYADLFDVAKERDAYQEVIFAIQHTRDATAASASSRGSELAYNTQPQYRYHISGNVSNGAGAGAMRIQPWFYDFCTTGDYENDYRAEVSFITRFPDQALGRDRITYPEKRQASNEAVEQFPYLDKYRDPSGLQARNNENDLFVIRLSEVYLIKAEAENELNGPTAEAYAAFNKLRERARLADGTARTTPADLQSGLTKEQFRMKIADERGLELVGEGHRWFDSIRMKYADNQRTIIQWRYEDFFPTLTKSAPSYNAATYTWGGGRVQPLNIVPFSKKFLIWAIPSSEIDANPNMTQNEGWF
ncbi:MAG: RagB/SusD family nutrient uptake outer membrane protein [Mangrovibacterium sp.]